MSPPVPSSRRLAIAVGTAATSVTLAVGVTAAALLGWFRPSTTPAAEPPAQTAPSPDPPAASPVILVPITPATPPAPLAAPAEVQLVMDEGPARRADRDRDDDDDHEREHHSDREEDGDDD